MRLWREFYRADGRRRNCQLCQRKYPLSLRGATRWTRFIANLSLLRLFSTLFLLQPPWRGSGHSVHTVLLDTFSGITVMQSLKVKHDAIIRRGILRGSLASFLHAARKTSTRTTKNERTALRSVSIRKVRCRDIRFTRRIPSAFIATASLSLSARLINHDEMR